MAEKYIHFTAEQKLRARQTDIVSMLESRGEAVKRSGKEYEWRDGSQKVTIRGNLWFHQYEREGGDAVDFVRRFYGLDYPQAVTFLLGDSVASLPVAPKSEPKKTKPFELPERNSDMHRVYAYLLKKRGLDRDVVHNFAHKGMIYESGKYHNAVFVGFDRDGIPRHANMRGTVGNSDFKGNADSSMPEYSFHISGESDRIYLFESPIDMLSFISLHKDGWEKHSYAAACCVSDRVLFQMLEDNKNLSEVYLCMDNDEAGRSANKRISQKLSDRGIKANVLVPINKDWNEDLLSGVKTESEDENNCPELRF